MKIRAFVPVLLTLSCLATHAGAQDYGGDFTENMDSYRPPPMFEDGSVKKFPVEVKTKNNSVNPTQPAHEQSAPVQKPVVAGATPTPQRRPEKFKASPELLKKIMAEQKQMDEAAVLEDDLSKITRIEPQAGDAAEDITSGNHSDNQKVQIPAITQDITTRIDANKTPIRMVAVRPVKELQQLEQKPASPSEQVALNPPETIEKNALVISLFFDGGVSEISPGDKQLLELKAIPMLKSRPDLRVQVQAFADIHDEGQNAARRLSLSRAISIRSYLVERDIDPGRIDLRALGSQTPIQPPDRADIMLVEKGKML